MNLRSRIALALLVICLVLIAPAIYSWRALGELQGIARDLRARDARGALALGRMHAAFREVDWVQRNYLPLAVADPTGQNRADAQARIETNIRQFESQFDSLAAAQYEAAAEAARLRWEQLKLDLAEERRLIDEAQFDAAEAHREQAVIPGVESVEAALQGIGAQIDGAGEQQAEAAEQIAERAQTTTLLSLALALSLAVLIASLLARSLLRPIMELRWGMSEVASGSFEPAVEISQNRRDEIGDLARSFEWMTHELAEYDRLRSEFVSIASHELKTPLSVIKGYVALLQEGIYGEIAPEQRKVLGSVADQSDRLGRLIQQLLDISRFEAGGGRLELHPIDLRAFLAELATSFEALAIQNEIEFTVEVQNPLPVTLLGDPDRLNEVLGNLLSNAFKFTDRHGRIWLRASGAEDAVHIEVEDTGVGIPESQISRIFEKFFQVENTAQPRSIGSGLGLAIAKEIVDAHGGTITAASEEGRGTTFTVVLPLDPRSVDRTSLAMTS